MHQLIIVSGDRVWTTLGLVEYILTTVKLEIMCANYARLSGYLQWNRYVLDTGVL